MAIMTLRELCEESGASRRAIQGYEKEGLVHAFGKNERGYLLYDDEMRERVKLIKFYQDLGFSLKEIKGILDAPEAITREALRKKIGEMEQRKDEIGILIEKVQSKLSDEEK